jgi:hypothetical protein
VSEKSIGADYWQKRSKPIEYRAVGSRGRGTFALALLAAFALSGGSAAASQDVESFSASRSSTQAGGHPDLSLSLRLDTDSAEAAKTVRFEAPLGVTLNPHSLPTCSAADLGATPPKCPPGSQIGLITVYANGSPDVLLGTAAVHSLTPAAGEFGRIGFRMPTTEAPVVAPVSLEKSFGGSIEFDEGFSGEYPARVEIGGIPQATPLQGVDLSLWGVPADPAHDGDRFPQGVAGCPALADTSCEPAPVPTANPQVPFVTSPTRCPAPGVPVPLAFHLLVTTYQDAEPSVSSAGIPTTTGCDQLSFNPSSDSALTASAIQARTGLDVEVTVPQTMSPNTPSPSQLRAVDLGFGDAIRLEWESLNDHTNCVESEFDDCPPEAQLATAEIHSPLFPAPLTGEVNLIEQWMDAGFVLQLSASGYGVELREAMYFYEVEGGGEVVLGFYELPELPLAQIAMHFGGGPAALFVAANRCHEFEAENFFVAWDAALATQKSIDTLTIDEGLGGGPCPGPAQHVDVELSPTTINADGVSTTTATARVTDEDGIVVLEDDVRFTSTDPGQRIGQVIDNEDGTYSARITASNTPGSATITATDHSVEPPAGGSALLVQTAIPAVSTPPPSVSVPVTRIVRHPPRRSKKRRAVFSFTSSDQGAAFSCSLDRRPARPCTAPTAYPRLKPGKHVFVVFATNGAGAGPSASYRFTVKKQPGKKRKSRR